MKLAIVAIFMVSISVFSLGQQGRTVAITIDDLPVVSSRDDMTTRREITRKLIDAIIKAKIPAIGFVNEDQLYDDSGRDDEQVGLLRLWVDSGLALGNHTFSHLSLNAVGLQTDEADIVKGETITRELLATAGGRLSYFRHPYLETGETPEIKNGLNTFLQKHGYTVAPVTFEGSDYIFSDAYEKAIALSNTKEMNRIAAAYLSFMTRKLRYWQRQSRRLFGREIAQIMLIHANSINADHLGDLAAMLKRNGFRFVDIKTALKDKAYRKGDNYTGPDGISWLTRWALARGERFVEPNEPDVPKWVKKLSGDQADQ